MTKKLAKVVISSDDYDWILVVKRSILVRSSSLRGKNRELGKGMLEV